MNTEKETIRKLFDLPVKTAAGLLVLAALKGTNTKNYVEQLLTEHVEKNYEKELKKVK